MVVVFCFVFVSVFVFVFVSFFDCLFIFCFRFFFNFCFCLLACLFVCLFFVLFCFVFVLFFHFYSAVLWSCGVGKKHTDMIHQYLLARKRNSTITDPRNSLPHIPRITFNCIIIFVCHIYVMQQRHQNENMFPQVHGLNWKWCVNT